MSDAGARRRQGGNTFLGFIIGLICGLAVAVAVALFITKAPIPFVNKGNGKPAESAPIAGAQLPDPNRPFYPKETPPPAAAPAAPAPGEGDKKLSFYDLAPKPAAPTAPAVAPKSAGTPLPATATEDGKARYLLQTGAFRSETDADAMRARLALLGYDAKVSTAEKDGATLYRVRIGPIAKLEDMNRARATLAQAGVEASVVSIK